MAWQDMKTHWAWHGAPLEREVNGKKIKYVPPSPTQKKLDYVKINEGVENHESSLCIGVWDDDKYTPLHRSDLEFHTRQYTFDQTITGARFVKRPEHEKFKALKVEDMTKEQLINMVRKQWSEIAQLTLSADLAWDRHKMANRLTNSYIKEFEDRGLVYIPKKDDNE